MTADDRAWVQRVQTLCPSLWGFAWPPRGALKWGVLYVWIGVMKAHRFAWRHGVRL